MSDIADEVAGCMIEISNQAEKILAEHAPVSLKGQCGDIAKIHHCLDVAAFLTEELIKENKLIVPNEKTSLRIWGCKKLNNYRREQPFGCFRRFLRENSRSGNVFSAIAS